MTTKRQSDLGLLLPSFQRAIQILLTTLRERGYDPKVFETYRSPEREAVLDTRGAGSKGTSLHLYGAACDIVSESRMWDWPEFYVAMAEEAEKLGMVSGHYWRRVDSVHIQPIPVNQQNTFRRLKPEDRDGFIRPYLLLPYHPSEL